MERSHIRVPHPALYELARSDRMLGGKNSLAVPRLVSPAVYGWGEQETGALADPDGGREVEMAGQPIWEIQISPAPRDENGDTLP